MSACECGCGEEARPGKRFIHKHYSRTLRRDQPRPVRFDDCPRCHARVQLRDDGSFGLHWVNEHSRSTGRFRCPEGLPTARLSQPPKGRRVQVTVDVVIPHGWSIPDYRARAARLLREQSVDGFVVVDVTVSEQDEAAS